MIIEFPGAPERTYAVQIATPSLGDYSYLVVSGDEAVLIDPQLDIDRFERILADSGARLRWVFETHMHNDYVSGGKALAERHGADYVLPAGCGATFNHSPISDGDSRALGRCALKAMHTPGHTPHHMSFVLELPESGGTAGGAAAVFSGGSMLVGAVGRTDLLGPDLAEELAHAQYQSVNRMADLLPDPTTVGPTHGAGSFCSATPVAPETTSTIGLEKTRNPALVDRDEDAFVAQQLAGYGLFPSYYAHMGPANQAGDALADPVLPPLLTPHQITDAAGSATIVDLRDSRVFAAGHIPGSVNVPMSVDAGAYIGWTLRWNSDLVLLSDRPEDLEDVRAQLHLIGVRSVVQTLARRTSPLDRLEGGVEDRPPGRCRGSAVCLGRPIRFGRLVRPLDTDGHSHRSRSNDPTIRRPSSELVAIRQLQLAQHRRYVRLDCLRRDREPRCDLLVAVSPRDLTQYFPLARCQAIQVRIVFHESRLGERVEHESGKLRREHGVAACHTPDGRHEVVRRDGLRDVAPGSRTDHADHILGRIRHRQRQESNLGVRLRDAAHDDQPATPRHVNVHQHNVGAGRTDAVDRLIHVGGGPGNTEVASEFGSDATEEQLVIVDEVDRRVGHGVSNSRCTSVPVPTSLVISTVPPRRATRPRIESAIPCRSASMASGSKPRP